MKKSIFLTGIAICLLFSGCELTAPSVCNPGAEKCETNRVMGGGILYTCDESGEWVAWQACNACVNNTCSNESVSHACNNEGESSCKDLDTLSVQFECSRTRLIPTACGLNCKCEGNRCSELREGCVEGEQSCVWIDGLNLAVYSVCMDNQLKSMYCGNGLGCNGNVCATETVTCTNTGEVFDGVTNSCVCDTAAHWRGKAGSCECESGYLEINDVCEKEVVCTNKGESLGRATNTCVCDTASHWVGEAGSCECESGYLEINDVCEEEVVCTNTGEALDRETNTCVCDTANHWAGEAGSCECTEKCGCDGTSFQNPNDPEVCCDSMNIEFTGPSCLELEKPNKDDTCFFGHYRQLIDSEELQPIEWMVLEVDDSQGVRLVSKYALDIKKYNETSRDVTWETCTMRSWLNGFGAESNADGKDYTENNFIHTAFSDEELSHIQTVINTNIDQSPSYLDGGNPTEDKVFLLKRDDVKYIIGPYPVAFGTPYVSKYIGYKAPDNCRGDVSKILYAVTWTLRMPVSAEIQNKVKCITAQNVKDGQASVNEALGVRPSLWIKKQLPSTSLQKSY